MALPLEEVKLFFRLHRTLMWLVNRRLQVLDQEAATPDDFSGLPAETRIKVHEALLGHRELIDAFADENPFQFSEEDLAIVRSWKHLVTGRFYAFRQLAKYMVFLTSEEPVIAYGVVALFDPFEDLIGPYLPWMVRTTLLPFRDRIVYDGLIASYNIEFGPGIRRSLNESYQRAKERFGIVTQLPFDPGRAQPVGKQARPGRMPTRTGNAGGRSHGTEQARRAYDEIAGRTDAFCQQYLDEE
jgi:hypothetical protein